MSAIEVSSGRTWGRLVTQTPLVQSYPGGRKDNEGVATKDKKTIIYTRTWTLGRDERGDEIEIPVISGDSIRGRMRRLLATELLEHIGCDPHDLPLRVAHLLFVGGSLGKGENKEISPDQEAELRALIPEIALFGGTVLGSFFTGRLRAGSFVAETAQTPLVSLHPSLRDPDEERILPNASDCFMIDDHARNGRELTEIYSTKEFDDAFRPSNAAADADVAWGIHVTSPHAYKCVVPGVTFDGWLDIAPAGTSDESDAVQRALLRHAVDLAYPNGGEATVGLRASNGYGVVAFDWDNLDIIAPSGQPYLDHLDDHADEIRSKLTSGKLVPTRPAADKKKRTTKKGDAGKDEPKNGAAETSAEDTDEEKGEVDPS